MLNDCTSFGLPFEKAADVQAFIEKYGKTAEIHEHADGSYAILKVDDAITLTFYGTKAGVDPLAMEPFYMPRRTISAAEVRWLRYPENAVDSGLLSVYMDEGEAEFPLNIEIPDASLMDNETTPLTVGGRAEIALILFAESLEVYENAQAYEEGNDEKSVGAECVIPVGTFAMSQKAEDFTPGSQVLINGIVQDAVIKKNPLTGLPYWNFIISCLGYRLEAVAALSEVPELRIGNVVEGLYHAAGRIVTK